MWSQVVVTDSRLLARIGAGGAAPIIAVAASVYGVEALLRHPALALLRTADCHPTS